MVGIIRSVDGPSRRCTVEVAEGSGRRLVSNVIISEALPNAQCTPENGTRVTIAMVDGEWRISSYLNMETASAQERNATTDQRPGDNFLGTWDGARTGVLKGGIAFCQSDESTGFVSSGPTKTANILGKTIAFLNSLYQKTINNNDLRLRIYELLSGPLPVSAKRTKTIDTSTLEDSTDYEGFRNINIRIDKNLASTVTRVGTNVSMEFRALNGVEGGFYVDGLTGDVIMKSGSAELRWSGLTGKIMMNSDGTNPLDGVLNGWCRCQVTGLYHVGGSQRVSAGL